MKKAFYLVITLVLMNCTSTDEMDKLQDATLIGRWNLENFEGNILYEFTADKRFTLYSSNGVFETLEEVIASGRSGDDWWFEGDKIVVDLNFGNFSTLTPAFKCDNNVIVWTSDLDEIHSTYYREAYNLSDCSE